MGGARQAYRRATHNAVERARRDSLNNYFQVLVECLPALRGIKRAHKRLRLRGERCVASGREQAVVA